MSILLFCGFSSLQLPKSLWEGQWNKSNMKDKSSAVFQEQAEISIGSTFKTTLILLDILIMLSCWIHFLKNQSEDQIFSTWFWIYLVWIFITLWKMLVFLLTISCPKTKIQECETQLLASAERAISWKENPHPRTSWSTMAKVFLNYSNTHVMLCKQRL